MGKEKDCYFAMHCEDLSFSFFALYQTSAFLFLLLSFPVSFLQNCKISLKWYKSLWEQVATENHRAMDIVDNYDLVRRKSSEATNE